MKIQIIMVGIFAFLAVAPGCVPHQTYEPKAKQPPKEYQVKFEGNNTADNNIFFASIEPVQDIKFLPANAFRIKIQNKTSRDIEILWDKTYYIHGGQTQGTFMFDGIMYLKKNDSKPNDVVFANSVLDKVIYPSALATFNRRWSNHSLPGGDNGIYITVVDGDMEIKEKIVIFVSLDSAAPKKRKRIVQ
ncbi:hypothetical protein [Megalodesulfovibrio gigas]|uniref:Lipoprotein n=1 Tax=Megalodesulfovibrio gigas (strain ATCC 19364 / DSM 1382 / NCIMB 9332 / VKM B-1759) TaxID=1121448 RepID=T2GCZ5_MEGG1|nr:hypothetical protein [Megalodesulfovibrio gigas]AGW13782.1 hypothetical protein DGI_2008 [Megalodesulfovibrio gigas DSM 1382 = ATCC 19364]